MEPARLVRQETTDPADVAAGPDPRDLMSALLDGLPDAVIRFSADGRIVYANTAFRHRFGPPEGLESAARVDAAIGPDALRTASALTPAAPRSVIETVSAPPGSGERWTRWTIQAVFDAAGRLVEYQASGHDITDERRYQLVLERMMASITEIGVPLGAAITEVLEIGRDYCRLDAAVLGRYDAAGRFEITHSVGRIDIRAPGCPVPCSDLFAEAALHASGPVAVEDVDARGLRRTACLRSTPVSCFVGQRLDIGDGDRVAVFFYGLRPRREPFGPRELMLVRLLVQWLSMAIERHEQMEALAAGRSELAMILETMPAHIAYKDREGRVLTANAAARDADWPEESRIADADALAAGEPVLGRVERWEDEEVGTRWMRTDRIPFAGIGRASLLVVATDVTELVEKERDLARANAGLSQFTYIASHDLQEPLRKIGTFTDLLTQGLERGDAEDIAYSVRVIKDSARRASTLIQDLLAWSRLTNRNLERAPVPFAAIVRDVVADVLSHRPEVTAGVWDELSDLTIRADAAQIRQMVENLVTNAIKYRAEDRPVRFRLRFGRLPGGNLRFEMEDNGIGFDPVYAAVIFEPFRRLHSDRRYTGSGIGLAICAKVCERHGWTISAEGRPGEGATFRVDMPVKTVR